MLIERAPGLTCFILSVKATANSHVSVFWAMYSVGRMNSRVALQLARLESGPIVARGVKRCSASQRQNITADARQGDAMCDVR
ncbi:uncharacterized protein FPRO_07888 [Fusarium proliferatum ET1]|uniref:Uncharacterized protein n=1 Tax=Fusarium proliferatum (strain ET1) TaxID=1227346 RepID=A0A1L7VT20_FUSPR|nr:uncharacterized protein FPRO_07888 [Fusarium proliferatum ET1]CVK89927.1 uncharacterized protein FPRN_07638 [Fusarium proliferatum]CZR43196.1 uncharacterized protein FPRO_07888 [Fusarium proliferatum ET1]